MYTSEFPLLSWKPKATNLIKRPYFDHSFGASSLSLGDPIHLASRSGCQRQQQQHMWECVVIAQARNRETGPKLRLL